jgi:MinD-like ATPase involved in chromosome partitioning or flagellar assembly
MTTDEHDNTAASGAREATELYPFSSGYPHQLGTARGPLPDWQAADQPLPDLPELEQLPDPGALPDPGYPPMPATPPPVASQPPRARPPWPAPPLTALDQPAPPPLTPLDQPPPPLTPLDQPPPPLTPLDQPPPPLEPPLPSTPLPERTPPERTPPERRPPWQEPSSGRVELPPLPSSPRRRQSEPPSWLSEPRYSAPRPLDVQPPWTPDPYTAPRPPESAPPLRGPSVPWSQVRVGSDTRVGSDARADDTPTRGDARTGGDALAGSTTPPPMPSPPMPPPPMPPPPMPPPPMPPSRTSPPQTPSPRFTPATPPPSPSGQRPTADTLTSDLLLPGKRATPDGGWRRTVYRATGGLVRVGESAASTARRDLEGRVRAPVAGGHHRVAVLSLKGGVGKTTVTVGLGSTLASLRGDRVIAVDGNPDRGTLSDKVRLETPATIRDLLNERMLVARYADVRAYTSQAPSRLEILASDRDPGVSVAFSADDYRTVAGVLERYYSICITDCGTGLLHSAMHGILELADQIVLVSSPSVDGARSASATLDWLDAHGYADLVGDGVVVLSAIRRKSKSTVDLDRLEQHFAGRCRAVVRVPYDPHLEEGAEFELELLNADTADAYLNLAALVADGFAQPRRSPADTTSGRPLA